MFSKATKNNIRPNGEQLLHSFSAVVWFEATLSPFHSCATHPIFTSSFHPPSLNTHTHTHSTLISNYCSNLMKAMGHYSLRAQVSSWHDKLWCNEGQRWALIRIMWSPWKQANFVGSLHDFTLHSGTYKASAVTSTLPSPHTHCYLLLRSWGAMIVYWNSWKISQPQGLYISVNPLYILCISIQYIRANTSNLQCILSRDAYFTLGKLSDDGRGIEQKLAEVATKQPR